MPLRNHITAALLLVCSAALIGQNSATAPAPASKQTAPRAGQPQAAPAPAPAPEYSDPCEARAMTVDFDTCYADQFKLTDQDLNRLYRNALTAFESDVADAHKRGDESQLSYDAAAIGDLRAAQSAWTRYRDLECRAAGQQLQGGSIQPIVVNKCMILVTRHRIDEIRAAYEIGGRNLE
jgi:uncharacterized protein YecT (DUF1311 family)